MHAMFIVVGDTKKVKPIVDKLREIGIKGATIIDTAGGGSYCSNYLTSRPAIASSIRAVNDVKYFNKTILSIVYCEKHLHEAMDAVEELLGGNMKEPGKGIIFTIPVIKFRGGELERFLNQECE